MPTSREKSSSTERPPHESQGRGGDQEHDAAHPTTSQQQESAVNDDSYYSHDDRFPQFPCPPGTAYQQAGHARDGEPYNSGLSTHQHYQIDPSLDPPQERPQMFKDVLTHLDQGLPPLPPPLSPRTMSHASGFFAAFTGGHLRPSAVMPRSLRPEQLPPSFLDPPLGQSSSSAPLSRHGSNDVSDLHVPHHRAATSNDRTESAQDEEMDDDECMNRLQPLRRSLSIEREYDAYNGLGAPHHRDRQHDGMDSRSERPDQQGSPQDAEAPVVGRSSWIHPRVSFTQSRDAWAR